MEKVTVNKGLRKRIKEMKPVWRFLMRLCWRLEDLVDRVFGQERAARFYPSAYWEKKNWMRVDLPKKRRGRHRILTPRTQIVPPINPKKEEER